jgi:hypothetical protein
MGLLNTDSHYLGKSIKSSTVFVITCTDIVAMSASLKNRERERERERERGSSLPGLPASERKIIGSAKHNYCFFAEAIVRLVKCSQFE